MQYDERIDDVILKILCTQPRVSYLKLKRNVDSVFKNERLNRGLKASISFETINSHLKGLVRRHKVKRQVQKPDPSSKVFYSVTKEVNCYAYKDKSFIDILRV
jgi:DNA-binding HxlR family transcriptional regulator